MQQRRMAFELISQLQVMEKCDEVNRGFLLLSIHFNDAPHGRIKSEATKAKFLNKWICDTQKRISCSKNSS